MSEKANLGTIELAPGLNGELYRRRAPHGLSDVLGVHLSCTVETSIPEGVPAYEQEAMLSALTDDLKLRAIQMLTRSILRPRCEKVYEEFTKIADERFSILDAVELLLGELRGGFEYEEFKTLIEAVREMRMDSGPFIPKFSGVLPSRAEAPLRKL